MEKLAVPMCIIQYLFFCIFGFIENFPIPRSYRHRNITKAEAFSVAHHCYKKNVYDDSSYEIHDIIDKFM